jgi:hydroxymethylglutaryl-CoA lyase
MSVKIIECPRDAMQGIHRFIPTDLKIKYLNQLLKVGYHTLDCASFVSPKAIPQLADSTEVLNKIEWKSSKTKLSVIVANRRGVDLATQHEMVHYLGFPFSISEEFQKRNTNKSIEEAVSVVEYTQKQAIASGKKMVVYISMGFGNNYGEAWDIDLVGQWVNRLAKYGVDSFSISDTVGVATPEKIENVYELLLSEFPSLEFGAHFHTTENSWREKVTAAWNSGCSRFDGAIGGYGGCPMAEDDLVGNMPTERLVQFFSENQEEHGLNLDEFEKARVMSAQIFP